MKRFFILLILLFIPLCFIGCNCNNDDKVKGNTDDKVKGNTYYFINISKSNVELEKGDKFKLTATYGDNATEITFSSSDESIALVTSDGEIAAVSEGKCYITAKANGSEKSCEVNVVDPVYSIELIYSKSDYILKNAELQIDAIIKKDSKVYTGLDIEWTVNGTKEYFRTLSNGCIVFKSTSAGTYTIKATTSKCSIECVIVVVE